MKVGEWLTIKAVFFDIDGTLLTDQRVVSKSTIFAINALKEKGILVGLATGRDPRFILPYMAGLGLDVAIAYNGQYIFSRNHVLFSQILNKEDVAQLVTLAERTQKDISFGTAKGVVGSRIMSIGTGNFAYRISRMIPSSWASFINFIFNRLIRFIRPQRKGNLQGLLKESIYQIMLLATEKETATLSKQFPHLSFTRSSPYATDIVSQGSSKLEGIRYLSEYYGFSLDQVIAFGDSNNDIEMLEGIACSVAMKNGTKKAKQVASYVTESNNHDGIFKALVHFGLIERKEDV